jgi:hypothetical protein
VPNLTSQSYNYIDSYSYIQLNKLIILWHTCVHVYILSARMRMYPVAVTIAICLLCVDEVYTRTVLNVAKKSLGATCSASFELNSAYTCDTALQPVGNGWLIKRNSDCRYHKDVHMNVTLGATVDVGEVGVKLTNTYSPNRPRKVVFTFRNSVKDSVYTFKFGSTYNLQKFPIIDLYGKATVVGQVNWIEVRLVFDSNTLNCVNHAGLHKLTIGAVFEDVFTDSGDKCVFPFEHSGNKHNECLETLEEHFVCKITNGTFGRCVLPVVSGCDNTTNSTPTIGPTGVSELWCRGQDLQAKSSPLPSRLLWS